MEPTTLEATPVSSTCQYDGCAECRIVSDELLCTECNDDEQECNQEGVFVKRVLDNNCEFAECVEPSQENGKDNICVVQWISVALLMMTLIY